MLAQILLQADARIWRPVLSKAPTPFRTTSRPSRIKACTHKSGLLNTPCGLARYRINPAHTAKYKIKPHARAVTSKEITILSSLGTRP